MPKKIENPLRSGLPSKIYLLAYGKPISGYEMARRIYGEPTRTSKIYGWGLKKLKERGAISKVEGGYLSNAVPLVDEIDKTLRKEHKIELSDLEKHIVYKILDSPEFRSFVEQANCNISLDQDIDSAWVIISTLGLLATSHLQVIALTGHFGKKIKFKAEPRTKREFDDAVEKIKIQLEGRISEPDWEKMVNDFRKILDSFRKAMPKEAISVEARLEDWRSAPARFAYFFATPTELIGKLQKLYPISELIHSLTANALLWEKVRKMLEEKKHADNP